MKNWQNPILFIAGLVTGAVLMFIFVTLLRKGPDAQLENMELRMELLQQQNQMMQIQMDLQDSVITQFRAILNDTTSVPE